MTHAEQARARKARALADALIAVGHTAAIARDMDEVVWAMVASITPHGEFPHEETKQAVYRLLEEHESPRVASVREFREAECRRK